MLLERDDSQLLLVDYQAKLLPALHEGALALANARRLAQLARLFKVPVWLTEENPGGLGATSADLQTLVAQTQQVAGGKSFAKMSFNAVADGLGELLRPPAKTQQAQGGNARSLPKHLQKKPEAVPERGTLVLAGCETHVCLMQTALALLEEEFDVWVVTDACASRTERNRDAAFDRLAGAGAELVTTEMVAFEWLRSAEHPAFAETLRIVKAAVA
ncbi:isochorismatase family protein [Hylemonella gracilis]|uniref:Isochorismatase hydrolase n=1 Tax=Hylemonella gracilis ATCC 19624 TaxID=887062 RepID=F3KVZ0_9BURK|nr:isochorismatase family protein [Hylemonella gracilis]EGI76093.1 isochorismatase hydrolase [Hylemonella gracilis ATCC 19624]